MNHHSKKDEAAAMNDEEKAWRLWHLMQEVSDALWERNERAFMKFCAQEDKRNCYIKAASEQSEDDLPF
jgi:hypothetical protein